MITKLEDKILSGDFLSPEEANQLWEYPLNELMWLGSFVRMKKNPGDKVGWIIDRNINITNICTARCSFCNFHRIKKDKEAYVTALDDYRLKIDELFRLGGHQLLLQGGLNADLGLDYYTHLFSILKAEYPALKLHALGPPEIHFLSMMEKATYREVLEALTESGLDSLPGAGAEILCDEVRMNISAGKCGSEEWLEVMREAHKLNLPTSATMMYNHIENREQRTRHLIKLRDLQEEKPKGHYGFITFIPWPFQAEGTRLKKRFPGEYSFSAGEYIRLIAISRIILQNIPHIQASWLTVGFPVAQICLHAGADDLGSIMIEENVVSAAGASYRTDARGIQKAIRDAGFVPRFRNQKYETIMDEHL